MNENREEEEASATTAQVLRTIIEENTGESIADSTGGVETGHDKDKEEVTEYTGEEKWEEDFPLPPTPPALPESYDTLETIKVPNESAHYESLPDLPDPYLIERAEEDRDETDEARREYQNLLEPSLDSTLLVRMKEARIEDNEEQLPLHYAPTETRTRRKKKTTSKCGNCLWFLTKVIICLVCAIAISVTTIYVSGKVENFTTDNNKTVCDCREEVKDLQESLSELKDIEKQLTEVKRQYAIVLDETRELYDRKVARRKREALPGIRYDEFHASEFKKKLPGVGYQLYVVVNHVFDDNELVILEGMQMLQCYKAPRYKSFTALSNNWHRARGNDVET